MSTITYLDDNGNVTQTEADALIPFQPAVSYQGLDKSFSKSYMLRNEYIKSYGFVLVTAETLQSLVNYLQGKKVLEVGAGTGYLANKLADCGIDIVATDIATSTDSNNYNFGVISDSVVHAKGSDAITSDFDVVIMSWPCYDTDFATSVANALKPGQTLLYQGEGIGGCTADNSFFDIVFGDNWQRDFKTSQSFNDNHVQFPGIHDFWYLFTKLSD